MSLTNELKFMVDHNVGKLTRWLRIMGYDAVFFGSGDDADMIAQALAEARILLTRDSQIMKRGVVTSHHLKAIMIKYEEPEKQLQQVIETLNLNCYFKPFTLCLECNQPLEERSREQVRDRVPPYVFKTQEHYMECPACHRIYWRGTHWQAMTRKLNEFAKGC